jgi:hypothetical protein
MRAILGIYLQTDTGERKLIAAVVRGSGVLQAGPPNCHDKMHLFTQNHGVQRWSRGSRRRRGVGGQ